MSSILFFFANFFFNHYGQEISVKYEIHYDLHYVLDTTQAPNRLRTVLEVDDEGSVFHTYLVSRRDSIDRVIDGIFQTKQLDLGRLNALKSKFNYRIFHSYASPTLLQEEKIISDEYVAENPFDPSAWEIQADTATLHDYPCQKATISYGGRRFEAWFTSALPLQDGPYVFKGLPGLVLEVKDAQNHYRFTYAGMLVQPPGRTMPQRSTRAVKVSYDKLSFIKRSYRLDPASVNANIAAYTAGVSNYKATNTARATRENNPLERNQ
jgi:GLPGLI family protein